MFREVPARVARHLLDLATQFGTRDSESLRVDHQLTQTELAQLVGAARETVNQALTHFTQHGWIQHNDHTLIIKNPAELAALATNGHRFSRLNLAPDRSDRKIERLF
jgi:CRP/FNR family cyclic AMP-dependent transcriptional regulator